MGLRLVFLCSLLYRILVGYFLMVGVSVMAKKQQGQDERALRRLIKRATANKNWVLLEILFFELGKVLEEEKEAEDSNSVAA